jgi:hypothetical protein
VRWNSQRTGRDQAKSCVLRGWCYRGLPVIFPVVSRPSFTREIVNVKFIFHRYGAAPEAPLSLALMLGTRDTIFENCTRPQWSDCGPLDLSPCFSLVFRYRYSAIFNSIHPPSPNHSVKHQQPSESSPSCVRGVCAVCARVARICSDHRWRCGRGDRASRPDAVQAKLQRAGRFGRRLHHRIRRIRRVDGTAVSIRHRRRCRDGGRRRLVAVIHSAVACVEYLLIVPAYATEKVPSLGIPAIGSSQLNHSRTGPARRENRPRTPPSHNTRRRNVRRPGGR